MSRWKAASIHFAISVSVITAIAALMLMTWYPPNLLWAAGSLGLIGILTGVDACLGPLLTLAVFKQGKPGLKFDLCVIALLQIAAISYGLHVAYLARPVYMVFTIDRFELVSAVDIAPADLAKARRDEFRSLPLTGPQTIAAANPEDFTERQQLVLSSMLGGADLQNLPQYYTSYAEMVQTALQKAKPLDDLLQRKKQAHPAVTAALADLEMQQDQVKYLPLRAQIKDQTVLIDRATGKVLKIIDIDPW